MKRIASFCINHDTLVEGIYTSRVDGDIVTYDIRMIKPNSGTYMTTGTAHTFEHLFATYVRNTEHSDQIIYVGPMGCRTGCYFVVRDSLKPEEVISLVRETMDFVIDFEGEIPGARRRECGNYLDHDLDGAKKIAEKMKVILSDWKTEDLTYPE